MTDNMDVEQPAGEQDTTSTASPSPTGEAQSSSVSAEVVEALLERLKTVEGRVAQIQSGKDKRVNRLEDEVKKLPDTFIARYEELRAKGLKPEEATREIELDDLLAERRSKAQGGQVLGQGEADNQTTQASTAHSSIIRAMKLDANDPVVLQAIREDGNDMAKFAIRLSNIATQKLQAAAAPANPAQVLPTEPGGGATDTMESKTAELKSLQNDFTPEGWKRRQQLKQELAALNPKT